MLVWLRAEAYHRLMCMNMTSTPPPRSTAWWHVVCSFQVVHKGVSYTVVPEGLLQPGDYSNRTSVHICRVEPPPPGTSGRAVLKIAQDAPAEVGITTLLQGQNAGVVCP
jgi:hypothetical protein